MSVSNVRVNNSTMRYDSRKISTNTHSKCCRDPLFVIIRRLNVYSLDLSSFVVCRWCITSFPGVGTLSNSSLCSSLHCLVYTRGLFLTYQTRLDPTSTVPTLQIILSTKRDVTQVSTSLFPPGQRVKLNVPFSGPLEQFLRLRLSHPDPTPGSPT